VTAERREGDVGVVAADHTGRAQAAHAVDCDDRVHAGLFRAGLPILKAARADLKQLRERAADAGLGVVDLPAFGQQTNDYDEFRSAVARTAAADLEYLGLAVYGARRPVGRLTGNLSLLR
jgi:hypothetical protein